MGRATARAFARRGALVAVLARGTDGLEATRRELVELAGRGLALECDVADRDAVDAAADVVEGELGPIDVWVNNAMTGVFAPFWEVEPDEFERVLDVVFLGQVNGTRTALRLMRARDAGVVIEVGSALAYRGIPLQSAYCSAKHAMKGFSESVRSELLHDRSGVSLCMVQLPAMNTPQFRQVRSKMPRRSQPVPPIFQPEIAAEAIVSAALRRPRQVWVTMATVRTILGSFVIPGLLDRYLAATGYSSQMVDEPEPADAPDNLFSPLPGDRGAHGVFDSRAKRFSVHDGTRAGVPVVAAAAGALALGTATALRVVRHR